MKVALFYPPVGNICQPYLSLPALVAYLKQNGIEDVTQYDFNVEVLDELLSPSRLTRAYRWSYHYLNEHVGAQPRSDLDLVKLQLVRHAVSAGPETINRVEQAKAVFRSDRFHEPPRYNEALGTIRDAFHLLSARYFPTVINNQGFSMRYRLDSSEEVLAAVLDEEENCFIDLLRDKLEGVLAAGGPPDIAGVSIGYYEQLIPGLTLARLIKKSSPRTHVTIGGTMMSALFSKSFGPAFFELFDSVVFFEGEVPLLRLIRSLARGEDLGKVPSLLFLREGKPVRTPVPSRPLGMDSMPLPDFTNLPLAKYLSPQPILPLAGSRGCYWRKCTFCTRQHFIESYRKRSPAQIVEDVKSLQKKYGASAFFFVDECFSPSTLNAFADRILAERLDIAWSCYVRFEKPLADQKLCNKLADSGLKMLYFGLESACQRVLDLMKKGTRKDVMGRILESTSAAGIKNMILYFVGFPTETREEAMESMEFLLDNRQHIAFAVSGQFLLEESSLIYADPASFGITEVSPLSPNSDLGIIFGYETSSGMTSVEAGEVKDLINDRTRDLHSNEFLNRAHLLLSKPVAT